MKSSVKHPKDTPSSTEIDFKAMTEASVDLILQVDTERNFAYVSPSVTHVLGWTEEEFRREFAGAVHDDDRARLTQHSIKLITGAQQTNRIRFRVCKKDGSELWIEGVSKRLSSDPAVASGFVVSARNVTEQKLLEDKLETLARTDGLTGLANRRAFDEALTRKWALARREQTHLSLLIADIDHFKSVNDHYGHQVGDDCLRAIASVLKGIARRPSDLAARYGGEELAIILPRTGEAGAKALGDTIRQAIQDLAIPSHANIDHGKVITVSVGAATAVCINGSRNTEPEALLQAADKALYLAKSGGRNRTETSMLLMQKIED
ncbi:sensor domain-containing diguanylate cyclase [Roseibium algae]|uniref:diguanylate cyclase n=1 Tax=Roseibium algae TaxID=3123038 RepID=A0ABU8TIB9_9HYPH